MKEEEPTPLGSVNEAVSQGCRDAVLWFCLVSCFSLKSMAEWEACLWAFFPSWDIQLLYVKLPQLLSPTLFWFPSVSICCRSSSVLPKLRAPLLCGLTVFLDWRLCHTITDFYKHASTFLTWKFSIIVVLLTVCSSFLKYSPVWSHRIVVTYENSYRSWIIWISHLSMWTPLPERADSCVVPLIQDCYYRILFLNTHSLFCFKLCGFLKKSQQSSDVTVALSYWFMLC